MPVVINKNFDNCISSTYQQKENIWKVKGKIHKIQSNQNPKSRNFCSIKSSNHGQMLIESAQHSSCSELIDFDDEMGLWWAKSWLLWNSYFKRKTLWSPLPYRECGLISQYNNVWGWSKMCSFSHIYQHRDLDEKLLIQQIPKLSNPSVL